MPSYENPQCSGAVSAGRHEKTGIYSLFVHAMFCILSGSANEPEKEAGHEQ